MNLRHMSFKAALAEAKEASGLKSNEAIANRCGYDLSSVTRYFQVTDAYCPSAEKIPGLCRALGNTILVDWLNAQVEDMRPVEEPVLTPGQVAQTALECSRLNGELCAAAEEVIADHVVTPDEARRLQTHHKEQEKLHREKAAAYEPLAKIKNTESRS